MIDKVGEYLITQGPWAAVSVALVWLLVKVLLKLEKAYEDRLGETKAVNLALMDTIAKVDKLSTAVNNLQDMIRMREK